MSNHEPLEIRALLTLLKEALFRADHQLAYFLNPDDPGLVETLRPVTAETASRPPGPGRKPIVSHANHVLYGIELANRAMSGEQRVYEAADWSLAWKLETVTETQWRALVDRLEQQSNLIIEQVARPHDWNEIILTGAFSLAAHAAYHLGAVRQMLLDLA